ncbi:MAG: hypothetical protein M3Y54_04035, partial [Bacteroidota bacterium]|nr:hypothetical protein [Bacteroidota bacterium]
GRSAWGWFFFALFLSPAAFVATWFVGAKPAGSTVRKPAENRRVPARRTVAAAPVISISLAADDNSIIDVTGLGRVSIRTAFSRSPIDARPPATPPGSPAVGAIYPEYGYDAPKLGKLYGEQLHLTQQQISWLNKFWCPDNAFLAIEAGREATARLYVAVLKELERDFKKAGSSLTQEVKALDGQARQARRQAYAWYSGESSFSGAGDQAGADIYLTLFKLCENAVRELYGHKRKISAQYSAQLPELEQAFQSRFGQAVEAALPALLSTLPAPDEAAELALNAQNPTRWKTPLDQLVARLPADMPGFSAGIYELGRLNARNQAIENIFFEASKLLAKHDPEEALRLYLHYLYHDLRSATINNKPIAKAIQKSLFPEPEHLLRFEDIARQLTQNRDLAQALALVPTVYARQRRKIQLDMQAVQAVRHQHAGTVDLLNEYLQDEPETLPAPLPPAGNATAAPAERAERAERAEIELLTPNISSATAGAGPACFAPALSLNATQQALLLLFTAPDLTLPQTAVEDFAKSHGTLRNQLIDSINERCYELLDDVLIEESGDDYTIYETYYQKISASLC